jgi:hypothetical protein
LFFLPDGEEAPKLEVLGDGSAIVDVRPLVPIPSSDQNCWTDENCIGAFQMIAECWEKITRSRGFELFFGMCEIQFSRLEFLRWVKAERFRHPSFWGRLTRSDLRPTETERPKSLPKDTVLKMLREHRETLGGDITLDEGVKFVAKFAPRIPRDEARGMVRKISGNQGPGPRDRRRNNSAQ